MQNCKILQNQGYVIPRRWHLIPDVGGLVAGWPGCAGRGVKLVQIQTYTDTGAWYKLEHRAEYPFHCVQTYYNCLYWMYETLTDVSQVFSAPVWEFVQSCSLAAHSPTRLWSLLLHYLPSHQQLSEQHYYGQSSSKTWLKNVETIAANESL